MEVKELTNLIKEKLKTVSSVKNIIKYQGDKFLQVYTTDGDLFNIAVVKAQRKIKR